MSDLNKIRSKIEEHNAWIGKGSFKQSGTLAGEIFQDLVNHIEKLEASKTTGPECLIPPAPTKKPAAKTSTAKKAPVVKKNLSKIENTVKTDKPTVKLVPRKKDV